MNQFIATDLPLQVCHAIRRCGIFARSQTILLQLISFQMTTAKLDLCHENSLLHMTSLIPTTSLFSFGTSIPTSPRPGIGACILMLLALRASVRSFLRFSILLSLTHSAGFRRYWMTVGQAV